MSITQHFLVTGRVQGVSYRFFTQTEAVKLGLTGWVRNLSDGRVEVLAQGPKEKLYELLAALRQGPHRALVVAVEQEVVESHESMKEFKIKDNGDRPWLDK